MSIIKGTNKIVAGFGGTKENIGDVKWSYSKLATDNSGRLPLFTGETITSANTIYPEFYNWILAHTELQCTTEEYESALTTYGECAKYVIGKIGDQATGPDYGTTTIAAGSIRLPLIKNYIKAANPSEGIKNIEAGLPNITGTAKIGGYGSQPIAIPETSGAFGTYENGSIMTRGESGQTNNWGLSIDASRSSDAYGKSDTVTPASTTLYPWVVAYAAAIPASTAQAAEFQQGLSGKADTNLGNIPSNYDYVVESYKDDQGNWYRKYKSGWLEQGGVAGGSAGFTIVNLLKEMANTDYFVIAMSKDISSDVFASCAISNEQGALLTKSSFKIIQAYDGRTRIMKFNWMVSGQGA